MNNLCRELGHIIIEYEGVEYCEKCDWGYLDNIEGIEKEIEK